MRSRLDSAAAFNVSTIVSSATFMPWLSPNNNKKDIKICLCHFRQICNGRFPACRACGRTETTRMFEPRDGERRVADEDRKSTRLNSSHVKISYAVFCLKKKKKRRNN